MLFALYVAGIVGALAVAWVLKRFTRAGRQVRPLMMELPTYHWPALRNVAIGLWQRVHDLPAPRRRHHPRADGAAVVRWRASRRRRPAPPARPSSTASPAGSGTALALVFAPIGFNWQISIALVPGMAAREVAVSALGTVYALSATGDDDGQPAGAADRRSSWSLATALSLLAWFVFAPQCLSTLAAVKRETGGWAVPLVMAGYLFALAYAASFVTYRVALALGGG